MSLLAICDDCGSRYFSEKAKEQLETHRKTCYPYQSALAEQAKARPSVKALPDEPEYEPPDAELRREAARKRSK